MHAYKFSFLCLSFLCAVQSSSAQGTFQNLGFELATLTNVSPGQIGPVPFTDAFPGWIGYWGTNPASLAGYNGVGLGSALASIISRSSPEYSNNVIVGNYTAALKAGTYGSDLPYLPTAIAQTGAVPVTARSLRFSAQSLYGNVSQLAVSLDGQTITYIPLSSGPNYTTYGADITPFAGMTAELRFAEQPVPITFGAVFLDRIQFSDVAIPEPRVWVLIFCGGAMFGLRCWRRRT